MLEHPRSFAREATRRWPPFRRRSRGPQGRVCRTRWMLEHPRSFTREADRMGGMLEHPRSFARGADGTGRMLRHPRSFVREATRRWPPFRRRSRGPQGRVCRTRWMLEHPGSFAREADGMGGMLEHPRSFARGADGTGRMLRHPRSFAREATRRWPPFRRRSRGPQGRVCRTPWMLEHPRSFAREADEWAGCWNIRRVSLAERTDRAGCLDILGVSLARRPDGNLRSDVEAVVRKAECVEHRGCWNILGVSLAKRTEWAGCWNIRRVSLAERTEQAGCCDIPGVSLARRRDVGLRSEVEAVVRNVECARWMLRHPRHFTRDACRTIPQRSALGIWKIGHESSGRAPREAREAAQLEIADHGGAPSWVSRQARAGGRRTSLDLCHRRAAARGWAREEDEPSSLRPG